MGLFGRRTKFRDMQTEEQRYAAETSGRHLTEDQLRRAAMQSGGTVERRGEYMVVSSERPGLYGTDYASQRYTQGPDGKWTAG